MSNPYSGNYDDILTEHDKRRIDNGPQKCRKCNGTGKIACTHDDCDDCPYVWGECHGGIVDCPHCDGEGYI